MRVAAARGCRSLAENSTVRKCKHGIAAIGEIYCRPGRLAFCERQAFPRIPVVGTSIRNSAPAGFLERLGVPLELGDEAADALLEYRILGATRIVEGILHLRHGEDRGNA
jgi:hypothetical protein